MDGMGVLLTDLPPLVFVNTNIPQDRLRFTLMHEIGHLVLHQSSSIREVSQEIEAEAHRFASAFLMPKQEIKPQLRDLSISKLAQLKRHWRVSMSALLMRAKELGTITPADERQLWRELSRHGWRKREPAQFDVHGESPGVLYEELISLYRSELMYSVERLAKVTHLGISDVRSRVLPSKQNLRIVG
jgi:Zn-dependent peptidase ImmA (M78 family)